MKHLRTILRLNAASCLAFGALFVLEPKTVSTFLGAVPVEWLQVTGLLLVLNGAQLALASLRQKPHPLEVLYFSAGDILWFIGSLGLVGANLLVTSGAGQAVTMVVAIGVLMLGLGQVWYLAETTGAGVPKLENDDLMPANLSRVQAITGSWIAMKTWVKVWLFALNGLFLVAILFLPELAARLTLAAYVASGPLLAAMMIWQRGLTRLLGLAHLIPWLPLVAYLLLRLTSDAAGPMIERASTPALHHWVVLLLIATAVCSALDVYDWQRWRRGERFRLGTRSAARAGASVHSS